jgi:RNA polymerase sigma-70 factor (ECF subfamily)
MERYAAGDNAAFDWVYDALYPRLLSFLRRRLRDDSLAEDLVTETFIRMFKARAQFIPGSRVAPWAYAIARNLASDALRQRSAQAQHAVRDETTDVLDRQPTRDPDAAALLSAREVAGRLERALSGLPSTQRITYQLVRRDGMTLAQAARALDTTVIAVKLRLHRATSALRRALADLENEVTGA